MRKFAFGFVIVFLTLTTSFPAQSEQELTFITVDKFPPYAWMQDDKVTGLDVEIIQHLAQRTGITINIDLLPGKRVLKMLQDGSADGGFAAFKTVKRKEYIDYLEPPLHYSVYRLYVRKGDEFAFKNIQDLYGKAVGKNRGFHISEEFSQAEAEKRIHVYDLKSMEQGSEMLIADRIEVI